MAFPEAIRIRLRRLDYGAVSLNNSSSSIWLAYKATVATRTWAARQAVRTVWASTVCATPNHERPARAWPAIGRALILAPAAQMRTQAYVAKVKAAARAPRSWFDVVACMTTVVRDAHAALRASFDCA